MSSFILEYFKYIR